MFALVLELWMVYLLFGIGSYKTLTFGITVTCFELPMHMILSVICMHVLIFQKLHN